ncbi:UDP-glucose/GDP-mannose dehydrogenase family protein [Microbacterium sp. ET2]|uniref:UDP-glucose dehydrogenase family protein n=1 Tax=Microbacterium albipurpureum TaxID=3050384 RepID=UPI00259CFECF|nr:UDP-glucose/GDP-mannose dehydrogenase family protein [Microbacterium sp. ET2 (Ac-2212)]WJL94723.1 UDP-glucose/GDP-mannose dehydrogenase family protein [Microbacterium sp. ET2 (Ac-2212)]
MRLSVIGCGYLGAVHAAAMASIGHEVVGIDVDERKIASLSKGEAPFFEPGLQEILTEGIASGKLRFTTDMSEAAGAKVHFIGVGTPQVKDGYAADLTYVNAAVDGLLPYLSEGDIVAGKSTVPVGTAAGLAPRVTETGATLVWNPEFLREGWAVQDTVDPDRLVAGVPAGEEGETAASVLREVYHPSVAKGTPFIVTDYATAELVKVSANAFLATKISFINAMAEIAEVTGADVTQLADAIGHDARIGRRFLGAGIGFGGGCLPKDIRAFSARAEELGRGESVAFLRQVDEINLRRRDRAAQLVVEALGGSVFKKNVTVLGAAFKPHSDDIRDSPALDVAVKLHGLGAWVTITDPAAIENAQRIHPQLNYVEDRDEALREADAVIVVTEWDEYRRELDPAHAATLVRGQVVIDGRNCLDASAWRAAGWDYFGMGRP